MPKTSPFYSKNPEDPKVYHDNSACSQGQKIKPENKLYGTDGRQKCEFCKKFDDEGK